eukprot:m.95536 g.95536  ORF g.95536 m.95536 type:complete len:674 (+) comp18432_c0_seq1:165-2186(+)
MGDDVKQIVERLNKPPFSKNFTLISFDGLDALALLQVLNDVLAEISEEHNVNLKEEDPEMTISRMLNFLRVLKYKPPPSEGKSFRQGLVAGSADAVYPVLAWALPRLVDLQKRAKLARFLVRVEVPGDMLADPQVADANTKYEEALEDFKTVHKQVEALRATGFSTANIKKDITQMEEEKEQLLKRIERMKKKTEGLPRQQEMLAAARGLRVEEERDAQLLRQRDEQNDQLMAAEQKLLRTQTLLREARANSFHGDVKDLMVKMEEEANMNRYLLHEKLPQDTAERRRQLADLQAVLDEPAMAAADLNKLHARIQELTGECNRLVEKRMANANPAVDKLAMFRQQCSITTRKKETTAESMRELMDELKQLEGELRQKRTNEAADGRKGLKAEEFKRYVYKLRSKSTEYKAKKAELEELRGEYLVLAQTEDILRAKDHAVATALDNLESEQGIQGAVHVQEELEKVSAAKGELDEEKGRTLDDISDMVKELTQKIDAKKTALAPPIKELRELRQRAEGMTTEYEEKKEAYERTAAGLESNKSKLEHEVRVLREEVAAEESRYHYLNTMISMLHLQDERVKNEMQTYKASLGQPAGQHAKSLREVLSKKITEQEGSGKTLRERQKIVKESHEPSMRQLDMWKDLAKLLDCKRKCYGVRTTDEQPPAHLEEDRLVL